MTTQNTTHQDTTPSDVQLAALLTSLEEQKERIDARIADTKAQLVERHPEKGDYQAGDFRIRISTTNRLDPKKIEAAFPAEQFRDNFYKDAIDTNRFKAFMTVANKDLADYQSQSAPSVKVL